MENNVSNFIDTASTNQDETRRFGTVVHTKSGYGFIAEENRTTHFFAFNQVADGKFAKVGDTVSFEARSDNKGRTFAVRVRIERTVDESTESTQSYPRSFNKQGWGL
jgi:cold shock CspA family protein